jgi:hypothetical protein
VVIVSPSSWRTVQNIEEVFQEVCIMLVSRN